MNQFSEEGLAWYSYPGQDRDVIISTRVRLARNLANFPFPERFQGDDKTRVQTIIFDAFSKIQGDSPFHAIDTMSLSPLSAQILSERGVKKTIAEAKALRLEDASGIVMSNDGKTCCTINFADHLHIAQFSSGLDFRNTYNECHKIDVALQNHLQFAANYDFGYLCAAMRNTGSGMKLSARIHLPATIHFGKLPILLDYLKSNGIVIIPVFPYISQQNAAGCFFQIASNASLNGSEIDQIANMESICKYIAECERKILTEFADNKSTVIRNSVMRAYSISKFSMLLTLREAIDIISDIKFGLQLNLVEGIDIDTLCSLLYRVQNGHLSYLMENGSFNFESDIESNDNMKLDRLRAVILQEAFDKITLRNVGTV